MQKIFLPIIYNKFCFESHLYFKDVESEDKINCMLTKTFNL